MESKGQTSWLEFETVGMHRSFYAKLVVSKLAEQVQYVAMLCERPALTPMPRCWLKVPLLMVPASAFAVAAFDAAKHLAQLLAHAQATHRALSAGGKRCAR